MTIENPYLRMEHNNISTISTHVERKRENCYNIYLKVDHGFEERKSLFLIRENVSAMDVMELKVKLLENNWKDTTHEQ